MDFGKYIKELLLLHDCVILPGLGGFIANYKPAEFNSALNTANPPSKYILFNRNLIHNDGLLYAHVSDVTDYGYKDVQEMTITYIERIRRDTGKGMKHIIDELGYFYLDKENQIQFREEGGNNFLLESYGLPFLQYREFEKLPKAEIYRSHPATVDPLTRQRRIRRWIYTGAAACIVATLVLLPIKTGYFDHAGIDIPVMDSFTKEQTMQAEGLQESEISPSPNKVSQAGLNVSSGTKTLVKASFPPAEYHLVVGSFKDFGNARQVRNQLVQKGHEARILSTDKGFFRVSAGTFSAQSEAENNIAAIRKEYEKVWILSN
ncbi:SPOR domain-containing protein [Bacteroidota bacterium]